MTTKNSTMSWVATSAVALVIMAAIIVITRYSVPVTTADDSEIVVYKTPTCGCCVKWVDHLRDSGLGVRAVNVASTAPLHERFGIPRQLGSCHTAVFGDHWAEGHVPADLVRKLMTEKPDDIAGIAVPGMPMGSPGMEGPNPVEYQVVAYGTDGKVRVYATRQGKTSAE